MFENVDPFKLVIGPDGAIKIPTVLLERQSWKPGDTLLLEQTDDRVLITTGTPNDSPKDGTIGRLIRS